MVLIAPGKARATCASISGGCFLVVVVVFVGGEGGEGSYKDANVQTGVGSDTNVGRQRTWNE